MALSLLGTTALTGRFTPEAVEYQTLATPVTYSSYAAVFDASNDRWLYETNADEMFSYPASCTKLITALLVAESKRAVMTSETVTWQTSDDLDPSFSQVGLQDGDVLTWDGLVHCMLLESGGDAVQAAARVLGNEAFEDSNSDISDTGGYDHFNDLINARLLQIEGMDSRTLFEDGHGAGENLISARGLCLLLAECMRNEIVRTISQKAAADVTVTGPNARTINLTNTHPQAGNAGYLGGKTGSITYTNIVDAYNLCTAWLTTSGEMICIATMNADDTTNRNADTTAILAALETDHTYLANASSYTAFPCFALTGQSNSVGRYGPVDESSNSDGTNLDDPDPRILMWDHSGSQWVIATHPIDQFDEQSDDVGPWIAFAKEYLAQNPAAEYVGLIGVSDGGTGFYQKHWNRLDTIYGNAINLVNLAMDSPVDSMDSNSAALTPTLVAILRMQGENEADSGDQNPTYSYLEYLSVQNQHAYEFREDLNDANQNTPFVFSGLPPEWVEAGTDTVTLTRRNVPAALEAAPGFINRSAFVSTEGLASQSGDAIHLSAASQRIIGPRFVPAIRRARKNKRTMPPLQNTFFEGAGYAFYFDQRGVPSGWPIRESSGRGHEFTNHRVYIDQSGHMRFGGHQEAPSAIFMDETYFPIIGTNDWLLRFDYIPDDLTSTQGLIGQWLTSGNQRSWLLRSNGDDLQFYRSGAGSDSNLTLTGSNVLTVGELHEVEVEKSGSNLVMRVNGVEVDSASIGAYDFHYSLGHMEIGGHSTTYGNYPPSTPGYFRLLQAWMFSEAWQDSNSGATPPVDSNSVFDSNSEPGGGGTDPDFASVSLLAGFEGTNGDTSYSDEVASQAFTFSNSDISSDQAEAGSTSLDLSAASSSVDMGTTPWNFGTDPWTIEWFYRPTTLPPGGAAPNIFTRYLTTGNQRSFLVRWDSPNLELRVSTNGSSFTDYFLGNIVSALTVDQWHHIALVNDGSDFYLFVDGTLIGTDSHGGTNIFASTAEMTMGLGNTGGGHFEGYYDELRVTPGVARYTSAFTPPTTPLPRS